MYFQIQDHSQKKLKKKKDIVLNDSENNRVYKTRFPCKNDDFTAFPNFSENDSFCSNYVFLMILSDLEWQKFLQTLKFAPNTAKMPKITKTVCENAKISFMALILTEKYVVYQKNEIICGKSVRLRLSQI